MSLSHRNRAGLTASKAHFPVHQNAPNRPDKWGRFAARPDAEIDTSDIPELTDAQLAEMKRPEHFRPVKKQITARLDADALAWLKAGGKGYQSRMNAILRQAMLSGK